MSDLGTALETFRQRQTEFESHTAGVSADDVNRAEVDAKRAILNTADHIRRYEAIQAQIDGREPPAPPSPPLRERSRSALGRIAHGLWTVVKILLWALVIIVVVAVIGGILLYFHRPLLDALADGWHAFWDWVRDGWDYLFTRGYYGSRPDPEVDLSGIPSCREVGLELPVEDPVGICKAKLP